jgi:hypothetical protein
MKLLPCLTRGKETYLRACRCRGLFCRASPPEVLRASQHTDKSVGSACAVVDSLAMETYEVLHRAVAERGILLWTVPALSAG